MRTEHIRDERTVLVAETLEVATVQNIPTPRRVSFQSDGGKKQVVVWSDAVKSPVAVRYGWSNLPAGGLMNGRELPAYPFRTDTWPMVPHQSTGAYEVDKLR